MGPWERTSRGREGSLEVNVIEVSLGTLRQKGYHRTTGGCVTVSNVLASRALGLLLAMKWDTGNGYLFIRVLGADVCQVLPIIPGTRLVPYTVRSSLSSASLSSWEL